MVASCLVRNVVHHDRRRRPPVVHGRQAAVSLLPGRIPNLEFNGRVIQLHLLRQERRCVETSDEAAAAKTTAPTTTTARRRRREGVGGKRLSAK